MAKVILLTDTVLWGEIGNSRYMGAYAIAQATRAAGYTTTVIDYFTRHPDFFKYLDSFISEETIAIGMSSTFLAPFRSMYQGKKQRSEGLDQYYKGDLWFEEQTHFLDWFRQLKELIQLRAPKAKLVLGGVKSQFAIWRPELYSVFDYVVLGAADKSFPQLIKSLDMGEAPHCEVLQGISILNNQEDLKEKSCPEMLWTRMDAVQPNESLPLEVARGCIFSCKFCHYDKKESYKKSQEILKQEMIRNYELFGTTSYHFCDDCFNDHPTKVESLCEAFMKLPFRLEWVAYARVDVAVKFPHTIEMMVEAGARGLYWGLESFHAEVARKAGKGTPPDKVKQFLLEFQSKYSDRCLMEGSFITGLPGESLESLQSTQEWLCQNPVIDFLTVGSLGLMPYISSFDKRVFDYAEYSRNPEKYGFKKVEFKPNYWEHETMNSTQAKEWAEKMMSSYRIVKPSGFMRTIWQYPHLRSLGFSKVDIFNFARGPVAFADAVSEVSKKFDGFLNAYWYDLQASNCRKIFLQN